MLLLRPKHNARPHCARFAYFCLVHSLMVTACLLPYSVARAQANNPQFFIREEFTGNHTMIIDNQAGALGDYDTEQNSIQFSITNSTMVTGSGTAVASTREHGATFGNETAAITLTAPSKGSLKDAGIPLPPGSGLENSHPLWVHGNGTGGSLFVGLNVPYNVYPTNRDYIWTGSIEHGMVYFPNDGQTAFAEVSVRNGGGVELAHSVNAFIPGSQDPRSLGQFQSIGQFSNDKFSLVLPGSLPLDAEFQFHFIGEAVIFLNDSARLSVTPVPEPGSLALLCGLSVGTVLLLRKRHKPDCLLAENDPDLRC